MPPPVNIILSYAEIVYRVVVTYVSYDLADKIQIARHFAVFNHLSEIVAEYSAEVMMARI